MVVKAKKQDLSFVIPEIVTRRFIVWIVGVTPLLQKACAGDAVDDFLDKREREGDVEPKQRRIRIPQQEVEDSFYLDNGRCVHPAGGLAKACLRACKFLNIPMTDGTGLFTILGNGLLPIYGDHPRGRADLGRINRRVPHMIYRPEFPDWAIKVEIEFVESLITEKSICTLLNWAGHQIGIGDWRKETKGNFGCFRLALPGEHEKYVNRIPDWKKAKVIGVAEARAKAEMDAALRSPSRTRAAKPGDGPLLPTPVKARAKKGV